MKSSLNKMLYVEWYDAYITSGWMADNIEFDNEKGLLCKTIGFLHKEEKHSIRLVMSLADHTISEMMTIPKAWIKRKKVLRMNVPTRRKRK